MRHPFASTARKQLPTWTKGVFRVSPHLCTSLEWTFASSGFLSPSRNVNIAQLFIHIRSLLGLVVMGFSNCLQGVSFPVAFEPTTAYLGVLTVSVASLWLTLIRCPQTIYLCMSGYLLPRYDECMALLSFRTVRVFDILELQSDTGLPDLP